MPRRFALAALLLLAAPAAAQNWPTETGINQDSITGSFNRNDRLGAYPTPRSVGDDRREVVAGWLGSVQEWVEGRADMVGQRDRTATPYYDLRRAWDREWSIGR